MWHWRKGGGCQLAERDLKDSNSHRNCQGDKILWGAHWILSSLLSPELWIRNCSSEFTSQIHASFSLGDGVLEKGLIDRCMSYILEIASVPLLCLPLNSDITVNSITVLYSSHTWGPFDYIMIPMSISNNCSKAGKCQLLHYLLG